MLSSTLKRISLPSTCSRIQKQVNHLITLADLSKAQIHRLLMNAAQHKYNVKYEDKPSSKPLEGKSVALIFSKRSTRTRVASETATAYLGGHPMFLGSQDIQMGVNESLLDTSVVVSSMVSGIMARVGAHEEILELAKNSTVPVVNALTDKYHPTQILADLLTLHEVYSKNHTDSKAPYSAHVVHPEKTLPGLKVAWIGDANNILHSMMVTLPKLGLHLSAATPSKYHPDDDVLNIAKKEAAKSNTELVFTSSPLEAINGADVIVTDTWVSMGQEAEKAQRLKEFSGYQVTMDMIKQGNANKDWKFLHCLPRKPEEVDDEVFYSQNSLVFQEAENRKWTILAVFEALFANGKFES
ncbi:ornithine carbamoyltransferase [Basidiobolus meristosporus CBS 931.73]|uniref:ornithine carbamoyltransferase n=1 Tax=Basidiobolus meristosporus CBS 931.73 TaxID=1314790 RepID=A0A1Y1WX94_9FUNG|nr:ornithine carbamoyltransferase [Basidiobolus meristosporus CBS 931.73]|eukprot:ORX78179.1 ornithine carbamoyltransferase [Basidiobolus meristosporus CBS 931.73]